MTDQEKIKPCPFCGRELEKIEGRELYIHPNDFLMHHTPSTCFLDNMYIYPDQIEEWNKRSNN